jgi:hypothetical protein
MQRAIPTALLSTIRNLSFYYYSSPPSRDASSLSWGSRLSLTWTRIYLIGGLNSERGSEALEPLLHAREQGTRTSEPSENCITPGSPLCRDLNRATYILCTEHPRPYGIIQDSDLEKVQGTYHMCTVSVSDYNTMLKTISF